jgi:tetratricopeptide (TPR) repeat protein
MSRIPRRSGPRAVSLAAGLAAAILVLMPGVELGAQEPPPAAPPPEAAQREMQSVQEMLARATAEFDGTQQSRSIVLLDEIVVRLEALRRQGTLSPRGKEMLVQALELRGRAYFNIGLQEKAADSFQTLIHIQPQATLSKEKVSPKIVEYFSSVKRALVGYLAVSSKPAGSRVTLNGEFLSLTDFFPLEVLAGEYTVEVVREGYQTFTQVLSIAPRATETLTVELVRISGSCFFVTEPVGVEIWVDGALRATTAGSLVPERFEAVQSQGLNPARSSAVTEIGNLSLGSHAVEFRKKCFETVRRTIEVPEARDYDAAPVRMEESLASLRLTSDPPGARIFINGEAMGQTPRELDSICSGKLRIEVKHTAGKYVQDIAIAKNESLSLDCPIRPSLALLGVVAESASGERYLADAETAITEQLSKNVATLNLILPPRESVDRILDAEKIARVNLLPGKSAADADLVRKVTEKLAAALDVQGFLVALLPEEKLQRTAQMHLLAAGNTVTDRWDVTYSEAASFLRFVSAVDQKVRIYKPWTGVITVDTLLHEGVPILRVLDNSPAAQAGIQVGDLLYAAEGTTVARTADLIAAVETKKAGDKLALHLKGPSGTRAVELTVAQTPQEIPLNEPTLLYNKVMMDLRQQVEGYPGTDVAAVARLNLALCSMHFSDFAAAHEHLLKAKSELPARPGISQGTALYYLGLALEKLGYKKEAVDAYKAAAIDKLATLFNNDGPAVSPLASRRAAP